MQKLSKKAWLEIGIVSGIFVVLMIIAAFADLAINKALYYPDSLFGQFFDKLGELPTYLAAPIAGAILYNQEYVKGSKMAIFFKSVAAVCTFAGFLFAIKHWFWGNFISDEVTYEWVFSIFFSLLLTFSIIAGMAGINKDVMKKLLIFAIFLIIIMAVTTILIQILKYVWARQRFRTMTTENEDFAELLAIYGSNFEGFTPWYLPQSIFKLDLHTEEYVAAFNLIDDGSFKSFPSGHTAAASAMFAMILLPDIFDNLNTKKYKWIFWTIPAIYTICVGFSRILMGAHYLSDVVAGGFIGFGIVALTRYIIVSKGLHKKELLTLTK
ncbi:MAG: phosphatase PAP2 family protein [Bacillota bacterium]